MTGEKDPRNLMIVYTIIQKIVRSLDITNQVEELFEATFCYFPITFRPPPDNPYGITAKDLKSNLRKCFASTPLFAKFGLPLLIQKLNTTSGSAKVKRDIAVDGFNATNLKSNTERCVTNYHSMCACV